jgi:hypothetical protein
MPLKIAVPRVRRALAARIRSIRLGLWLLPVVAFIVVYSWRPFALGFYSDDWSGLVEMSYHGGPFSWERLNWLVDYHAYSRALQVLQQWVFTSLFGSSTVAWHLLMAALVAVSYVLFRRFLLALGVKGAVATVGATVWLVLPWSLGYTAWPTASTIMLGLICFLASSAALLRLQLWRGIAWFLASVLFYEAFYFQFVVVLLILLLSRDTRRWALLRAAPLLVAVQVAVAVANRLSAHFQAVGLSKTYDADWPSRMLHWLFRLPGTLSHPLTGPHLFALGVILVSGVFALVCAFLVKDRRRAGVLVALSVGFFVASAVVAVAGYTPDGLFTPSRVFVGLNVWMVAFLAVAWPTTVSRRAVRWALRTGVVVMLIILTVSVFDRTLTWQGLWRLEQTVIAAVPAEKIAALPYGAGVLVRGMPSVDRIAAFDSPWGISTAVGNKWPETRTPRGARQMTVAFPGNVIDWDGRELTRNGQAEIQGDELWIWTYPEQDLVKVEAAGKLQ